MLTENTVLKYLSEIRQYAVVASNAANSAVRAARAAEAGQRGPEGKAGDKGDPGEPAALPELVPPAVAEAGESDEAYMWSPIRVAQAIAALGATLPPGGAEGQVLIMGSSGPVWMDWPGPIAPDPTAPEAPVLALVSRTAETITVSWPAPADGGSVITGYRLYVGGALAVGNAVSPHQLVALNPATEYSITATALNAVGEGPQSAPLVVVTEAAEVDPDPDPDPEIDPHALGWGYLADRDEGTAGDWFVAVDGDDGAAGTLAAPAGRPARRRTRRSSAQTGPTSTRPMR